MPKSVTIPPVEITMRVDQLTEVGESVTVGDFVVTRTKPVVKREKRDIEVKSHPPGSLHFVDCGHVALPKDVYSFEGTAFQDDVGDAMAGWLQTTGFSEQVKKALAMDEVMPLPFWQYMIDHKVTVDTYYVCPVCAAEMGWAMIHPKEDVRLIDVAMYQCGECGGLYDQFAGAKECCA